MKIAYKEGYNIAVRNYKFGQLLKHANVFVGAELDWVFLNEKGYYEVSADPTYDTIMQQLGAYEIVGNKAVRKIIDKVFGTIEEEKAKKIQALKTKYNELLKSTDWYITRQSETGEATPTEILTERAHLRSECDRKESEINALTELREVLFYEF